MDTDEMRRRFDGEAFAVLGTHGPGGRLDLVPCCFVVFEHEGRQLVGSAVDHKPKRSSRLARLENVRRDPNVSFLVDRRDEDWSKLWWVRLQAVAVVHDGGDGRDAVARALAAKYAQYREQPPVGPAIVAEPVRWSGWASA